MAKVIAQLKVFPSDVSVDREKLKEELKKNLPAGAELLKFDEEPIAFGLVALVATVAMKEEIGGLMDKVEDSMRSNGKVGEVQTVAVGRM